MLIVPALLLMQAVGGWTTEERPVESLTQDQIIQEVISICVANLIDHDEIRHAIEVSSYKYDEQERTLNGLRSNWRTPFGNVYYVESVEGRELPFLPQCNVEAIASDAVDEDVFKETMTAALAARFALSPTITEDDKLLSWHVDNLAGQALQIDWMKDVGSDRQITISVQRDQKP